MRIGVFIFFLCTIIGTQAQQVDSSWVKVPLLPVRANEIVHNFGKIEQNIKTQIKFILVNDSVASFIIKDVTTSCGCTTSSFTKKPIGQNDKGIVKLKYDTSKPGVFSKSAFVYNNFSDKPIKLQIIGEVIADTIPESKANATIQRNEVEIKSNLK